MIRSLRAMRYVQAALKHGSITGAAEVANVTPSAIAAALDQAEATFGMALVTRARAKGILPTAAGRDIRRRIDDLLERYDVLLTGIFDLQSNLSGNLSIGYTAPIAPAFLPMFAAQMQQAGQDIRCRPIQDSDSGVTLSLGFAPGPKRRLVQTFVESCVTFFERQSGTNLTVSMA